MNINDLETATALKTDDLIAIMRQNEYNLVLFDKNKLQNIGAYYEDYTIFSNMLRKYESIKTSANALFTKFATKTEVNNTFISKETLQDKVASLLTYDNMDSILLKYADVNNASEKAGIAQQEASKLADEMTDFVGAAIVGINQSQASQSNAGDNNDGNNDGNNDKK